MDPRWKTNNAERNINGGIHNLIFGSFLTLKHKKLIPKEHWKNVSK